ncbi:MAG: hypothetical protein V8T86_17535 [Victivallis sp.]
MLMRGAIWVPSILSHPEKVDAALRRFDGPAQHLELNFGPAFRQQRPGRLIEREIDQGLFHAADPAARIDHIRGSGVPDADGERSPAPALLRDAGVIEVVRRRHRPGGDLLRASLGQRELAEIPVAAGTVFDLAHAVPPAVRNHAALRIIRMELRAAIRRLDPPEIDAERQKQPLVVRSLQPEMPLQPAVDAGIRKIVDRNPVRHSAMQGSQHTFSGIHNHILSRYSAVDCAR